MSFWQFLFLFPSYSLSSFTFVWHIYMTIFGCSWIENKKDHWYANPQLVMRNMEDLHKIKMSLWPTHKMNHQNQVERYNRRSLLVEEIVRIVKELDIEYLLYPIDINIKNNTPLITSSRMPTTWSTSALWSSSY